MAASSSADLALVHICSWVEIQAVPTEIEYEAFVKSGLARARIR